MERLNPTAWVRASCCNSVFIMRLRSMKVLIAIKTSYNTAKVPSLVDSEATDNFIHPRTVRQLRLGMSLLYWTNQRNCSMSTIHKIEQEVSPDMSISV